MLTAIIKVIYKQTLDVPPAQMTGLESPAMTLKLSLSRLAQSITVLRLF